MWVAVRYRTLFMSKHSSAPISDFFRRSLARARRSRRRRSKSIRFSQSTAIVPYVGRAIEFSFVGRSEVRGQIAEVKTYVPALRGSYLCNPSTVRRAYARPRTRSVRSARLHLPKAARTELEHALRPCA